MRLRYTPEAVGDLRELKRYISRELRNPAAAGRITNAIFDGCALLKRFPEMGVSLRARTGYDTDLRMFVVEDHIALYCVEKDQISVARVLNARQDYIRLLLEESN